MRQYSQLMSAVKYKKIMYNVYLRQKTFYRQLIVKIHTGDNVTGNVNLILNYESNVAKPNHV